MGVPTLYGFLFLGKRKILDPGYSNGYRKSSYPIQEIDRELFCEFLPVSIMDYIRLYIGIA